MITLDQIRQLDQKVRKAIEQINSLRSDNEILQDKLDSYQIRIDELEVLIDTFKKDQSEIEKGIINALNQLDILEDRVSAPVDIEVESSSDESTGEETESDPAITEEINSMDELGIKVSDNLEESSNTESTNTDSELDIF